MPKLTSLFLSVAALGACGDDLAGPTPATPLVGTSAVEFGATSCGTTAYPRTFVISNSGDDPFEYSTALGKGAASPYTVSPASGTIGPRGFALVTVLSTGIPQVSSTATNLYGDTLTLTTTAPDAVPTTIAITQTAYGAILSAPTAPVEFAAPQAVGGTPATQVVTVQNTGNADVSVTLTSAADSFGSDATVIPAGGSAAVAVKFTPSTSGIVRGDLTATATGPSCGASTVAVSARGTGSFAGTAASVALIGNARIRRASRTACVLLTSGHVACVGSDELGVRGLGPDATPFSLARPTLVRTVSGVLDGVVELAGFGGQVCARRADGDVLCWGNVYGEQADQTSVGVPYALEVFTGASSIATGYKVACAITNPGGMLECQGRSPDRWAGISQSAWTVAGASAVALNSGGGYALMPDKTVLSFGVAEHGVRGNADSSNAAPSPVTGLTNVVAFAGNVTKFRGGDSAGGGACAVKEDGTVWCWGAGRHGRNGDGTEDDRSAPVQVLTAAETPLTGATAITAGRAHRCAITSGGVYCWGRGNQGQLGRTAGSDNGFAALMDPAPTDVFTQIDATGRGTCAVTSTRRVLCWGETPVSSDRTPSPILEFEPAI